MRSGAGLSKMKKIVLIKPSSLGDVVQTLPLVTAISRYLPDAKVDWVVRPEYAALVAAHPGVRHILLFDRARWSRMANMPHTLVEIAGLLRQLRREQYDYLLDVQGLLRSGMLSLLSRARIRVGFENAREYAPFCYNRRVAIPRPELHAVDRYMLLLQELGLPPSTPDFSLQIPAEVDAWSQTLLSRMDIGGGRRLVVLNPNARWDTKKWIPERFAALADRLVSDLDADALFIGAASDKSSVEEIVSLCRQKVVSLAGATDLIQLAALLKRADLVITCDSGPMHLAAAVGTKVLALFGPTDPVRTGPYGAGHRVIQKSADCIPCLKRACPLEERICMESISVEEVLAAATGMWDAVHAGVKS